MSHLESLLRASLRNLNSAELDPPSLSITVDEARQWLIRVGSAAARGEIDTASRDEHTLHLRVLRAIAAGHGDAKKLASIAILTSHFPFDRD